jgi:predicted regulator of Ras-like GTPase activity (Roadblock/LC7/MglB family)
MKNFSDVIALFADLPDITGVLVVDSDALTLSSSFTHESEYLPNTAAMHGLVNDVFRNLYDIGQSANQVIIVQDETIILAQPVYDVMLVVYAKKTGLELLQNRFSNAVKILEQIAKPEFSNT